MKWVFLAFLIIFTPLLAGWLRGNRRHAPIVWAALGFLPFVISPWNLYIAPISWEGWPGFVKGMEVSLIDAIAIAVYASAPGKGKIRLKLPFLIYIGAVLISAAQADVRMPVFFHAWQIARMFLLFAAVAAACRDDRAPSAILTGLVLGLAYQAAVAAQAVAGGALQTGGSFGHQNLLGLVSHMVVLPTMALLLSGRAGWVTIGGPLAGIAVAVLGASRGTIGLVGAGLAALLALSVVRKPSSRKTSMALLGVVMMAVAAPVALSALDKRFATVPLGEYDERAAFESASSLMIADHPMGVGANQYVSIANVGGYFAKGGVVAIYGSRSAHVHNVYLLVTAETGYLGLAAFLALLFAPIILALRCAFRYRNDRRGELMLGLGLSLIVVAVHSLYEWVFITFNAQHVFAITVGLIVGVAGQLGYWNRTGRRNSRAEVRQATATDGIPAEPVAATVNAAS